MTVNDMKIGSRLMFGRYDASGTAGCECHPAPISWLKATKGNVFISEYVLDYIAYDAAEDGLDTRDPRRSCGNNDYEKSNILQFLNSTEENWFAKTHEFDAPPTSLVTSYDCSYNTRPGFLYHFFPDELSVFSGRVELPSAADISGNGYQLYKNKGVRTRGSENLRSKYYIRRAYGNNAFIPYWTKTTVQNGVIAIDRKGGRTRVSPRLGCGLRPVICLYGNAIVTAEEIKNKCVFTIKQSTPEHEVEISMESMIEFLNL